MNCFRHDNLVAVGVCKSCGKGLCSECAAELANGLACRDECEARVRILNHIIDNNSQTLSAARYQVRSYSAISLLFGGLFLLMALGVFIAGQGGLSVFPGAMGGALTFHGLRLRSRKALYPTLDTDGGNEK